MNPRCSRQARGVAPNAAAPQQPVRTTKDERVAPGTGVLAKNRLDFGGGHGFPSFSAPARRAKYATFSSDIVMSMSST